jgi:hypothetical protein
MWESSLLEDSHFHDHGNAGKHGIIRTIATATHISSVTKVTMVTTEVEAGNFTTTECSVLLNVGRTVLKMTDSLWKNGHITGKDA